VSRQFGRLRIAAAAEEAGHLLFHLGKLFFHSLVDSSLCHLSSGLSGKL
jgi:hypothetical protein